MSEFISKGWKQRYLIGVKLLQKQGKTGTATAIIEVLKQAEAQHEELEQAREMVLNQIIPIDMLPCYGIGQVTCPNCHLPVNYNRGPISKEMEAILARVREMERVSINKISTLFNCNPEFAKSKWVLASGPDEFDELDKVLELKLSLKSKPATNESIWLHHRKRFIKSLE